MFFYYSYNPIDKIANVDKPFLPLFAADTAIRKVRLAENAWNTKDPLTVSLAYTEDSF